MKLIDSKVVNLTPANYSLESVKKHIELCGRTCYCSEDKINDTSAEKFVNMLKSNHHMSVLEHGTVYLTIPIDLHKTPQYVLEQANVINHYRANPYSVVNFNEKENTYYVTTNYRVIVENGWEEDFNKYFWDSPSEHHEKRYTFRITCSRAIANEIVRHRQMSYSQESTRYCNYSKNKFGGNLTFIIPEKLNMLPEGNCEYYNGINYRIYPLSYDNFLDSVSIYPNTFKNSEEIEEWLSHLYYSSKSYFKLLNFGWKPEEARGILPLDLKTDLVVTGTKSQWDAFFKLRCAKSAHPDIQIIANQIKDMIYGEY